MIKYCKTCHKKMIVIKCLIKRKNFCSKICLYKNTSKRMIKNIYWKKTKNTQFKKGHNPYIKPSNQYSFWKGGGLTSKIWKKWSFMVKNRDKWICQHCKYKGYIKSAFIIAHHKIHYKIKPELKFEVSNGITLCRKCHPLFHPELKNNIGAY